MKRKIHKPTQLIITVPPLLTYSAKDVKQYVTQAVTRWAGSYPADDEMFDRQWDIKVRFAQKKGRAS